MIDHEHKPTSTIKEFSHLDTPQNLITNNLNRMTQNTPTIYRLLLSVQMIK